MHSTQRIPIPWKHRWRRFRHSTLPFLGFVLCLIITFWLWNRQSVMPNAIGEVEAVRVIITAGAGGNLLAPEKTLVLFDTVQPHQELARVDSQLVQARLDTAKKQQEQLSKTLAAEADKFRVAESDRLRSYFTDVERLSSDAAKLASDAARLRYDFEQRRLAVMDRQLQADINKLESARLGTRLQEVKKLYDKKMASELEWNEAKMLAEEAVKKVAEDARILTEVKAQERGAARQMLQFRLKLDQLELQRLTARLQEIKKQDRVSAPELEQVESQVNRALQRVSKDKESLVQLNPQPEDEQEMRPLPSLEWLKADEQAQLAPYLAAVETQAALIHEIETELRLLKITAPDKPKGAGAAPATSNAAPAGAWTVCAIHRYPGEHVRAGDPIVTLGIDRSRYIISYVRQEQRFRPEKDMTVAIRPRMAASKPVEAVVDSVGPQVELIPLHQCRDPKIQEWGLPVRIRLPEDFPARPGELLEVTFKTASKRQG